MRPSDRSALVTGAARCVGAAFATARGAEGAPVAIGDFARAEADYVIARTYDVDGGRWMS
jgi:NAD(P)-dependent dehydrogenase (short-subunit alcohol dehydrogenase family)